MGVSIFILTFEINAYAYYYLFFFGFGTDLEIGLRLVNNCKIIEAGSKDCHKTCWQSAREDQLVPDKT